MTDTQKIRIYSVGDSHGWHAWLKIPWAEFVQMGPMTMFTFAQAKLLIAERLPDKTTPLCFCYGEIDCRYRIHDHQPWQETVDNLVQDYLQAIDENAKINPNILLFNVVPPARHDKYPEIIENPQFPFNGTDEERQAYVLRMNKRLKESKYPFIDIYDKYCDEDGFLKLEMSDYHVHIADEKPLMEEVDKILKERFEQ